MEKQIELLLQVFANKDATLNETKEALLLLCNSSLQLPYTKTDLWRAYQAGCLESVDDCVKYSFKDLKELQQDSLKWIERYTK